MKKFALSVFVVISFVIYSLLERQKVSADPLSDQTSGGVSSLTPVASDPANVTGSIQNTPSLKSIVSPTPSQKGFRDGQYTGKTYDAYYGFVQVGAQIQNGKLIDVTFLQYPNDRGHSIMVSNYSLPLLRQEAIQAQSANVDIVSGATDTSLAFRQSLSSALAQAL